MTCIKAQSMITPFINDQLSLKELQQFLDHIADCPNCSEELKFYYTLLTAMKQLDEDKNLSDDFELELTQMIEKAQERVIHVKYTYYRKTAVLVLSIILLAFFLSMRRAENDKPVNPPVTESNFLLRSSFLKKNPYLEMQLQEYIKEHQDELLIPQYEE